MIPSADDQLVSGYGSPGHPYNFQHGDSSANAQVKASLRNCSEPRSNKMGPPEEPNVPFAPVHQSFLRALPKVDRPIAGEKIWAPTNHPGKKPKAGNMEARAPSAPRVSKLGGYDLPFA